MRRGLVLLGLVACGQTGAAIDINVPPGVAIDDVEIFVGTAECYEGTMRCMGGVAWLPGQVRPVAGPTDLTYVMETEEPGHVETRITAKPFGRGFYVELEADGRYAEPGVIAIVGLQGGQAKALKLLFSRIPENSGQHWVVDLEPTDPATDWPTRQPITELGELNLRATVWGREGATPEIENGSRCLVAQWWRDGQWRQWFIVPSSDHDCDGEDRALECDERSFNLNQTSQVPIQCVDVAGPGSDSNIPPVSLEGSCQLGVTTCIDGKVMSQADQSCTIDHSMMYTCAPDEVCNECGGPYDIRDCIQHLIGRPSRIPHFECELAGDATGTVCANNTEEHARRIVLPFPCAGGSRIARMEPFDPASVVPTAIAIGTADVSFIPGDNLGSVTGCEVKVSASGTIDKDSQNWFLLIAYPFQNDTQHEIVIPFRVDLEDMTTCTALTGTVPPECEYRGNDLISDNVMRCAGRPPM